MKIQNQHGDLLLEKIDDIPKGAKRVEVSNGYVLERGEGVHTHILEDVSGVEVYEKDGQTYVHVVQPTKINHEEHGLQPVLPGKYKKRIERVWDYEAEESRRTID